MSDEQQEREEIMENADPFHDSLLNTGDPYLADRECHHGYLSHENKCPCYLRHRAPTEPLAEVGYGYEHHRYYA